MNNTARVNRSFQHTRPAFSAKRHPLRKLVKVVIASCITHLLLVSCGSSSNPDQQTNPSDPGIAPAEISADLSNDLLLPPELVDLSITASPGTLTLSWNPIENQTQASVYISDSLIGPEEQITRREISSGQLTIPSNAQLTGWDRELIRLELCNSTDCISSEQTSLTGLVEGTVQRITPPVYVQGEAFGESIAASGSGTVLAVASPLEGTIDIYNKISNGWLHAHESKLSFQTASVSRTLDIDISSDGNVIAVLTTDHLLPSNNGVRILERLGEGWFETSLENSPDLQQALSASSSSNSTSTSNISISENGNHLLINVNHKMFTVHRQSVGWSAPRLVQLTTFNETDFPFSSRFTSDATLLASAANSSFSRLYSIHRIDQSLWLGVWQYQSTTPDSTDLTKIAAYEISNLDTRRDVAIKCNDSGNLVSIAGWESSAESDQTPVMWRYEIPDSSSESLSLSVIDSLRFPSTANDNANIRFDADKDLDSIVLGWQNPASTLNDAALLSYEFSADARRWIPKLDLPAVFPTLAKQSFVNTVSLTDSGNALFVGVKAGQSLSEGNRAGEIIAFY